MPLATFDGVVQDQYGNAISGAQVTVYSVVSNVRVVNPLPSIYAESDSDAASPVPIANPINTDPVGRFAFSCPDGPYDIVVSPGTSYAGFSIRRRLVSAAATGAGSGSVTSVALSAPAIFTVSGSPIVAAGTLAIALATQSANQVWAGPTTGAATTPTFRALVNADFPTSGVTAATYGGVSGTTVTVPVITVNAQGIVTLVTTQSLATPSLTAVNNWTKAQTLIENAVTFSNSITIDASTGHLFAFTATSNFTLNNLSNAPGAGSGQTIQIKITQDATGGRVITYGAAFKFGSGSSSVLSTAANAVDILSCTYFSSTGNWYCSLTKGLS